MRERLGRGGCCWGDAAHSGLLALLYPRALAIEGWSGRDAGGEVVTNPYAGLGFSTGILDVSSRADALEAVLQRDAPETLLDSWAKARRDMFLKVVDPMSRAVFATVQDPDPDSLAERDPMLNAVKKGILVHPPNLTTNVRELEGFA